MKTKTKHSNGTASAVRGSAPIVKASTRTRVTVNRAYKMYVGGAFVRSESGRYFQVKSTSIVKGADPDVLNMPRGSRKDVRDAVLAAKNAEPVTLRFYFDLALQAIPVLLRLVLFFLRGEERRHRLEARAGLLDRRGLRGARLRREHLHDRLVLGARHGILLVGGPLYPEAFAATLAQVSRKVTARFHTGAPGRESGSRQK